MVNPKKGINFASWLRNKPSLTTRHVMKEYSIFDLRVNDLVYIRKNGVIIQATILEMVSEVKLPFAEPCHGKVSTDIVLLLATGEKETIMEYDGGCFPSVKHTQLYMSADDCIRQNHVKSNITLACEFARKLFGHFGMKWREYPASRFHGWGIDHVFLYRKDATKVDKIAYDGFVYRHDTFENTTFVTTHYREQWNDPSTAINGRLDYLKQYYRLYPTEKAAYDALKPRVVTFEDNVSTTPVKMRIMQVFEIEVGNMAQVQALTTSCPASVIAGVQPTKISASVIVEH